MMISVLPKTSFLGNFLEKRFRKNVKRKIPNMQAYLTTLKTQFPSQTNSQKSQNIIYLHSIRPFEFLSSPHSFALIFLVSLVCVSAVMFSMLLK